MSGEGAGVGQRVKERVTEAQYDRKQMKKELCFKYNINCVSDLNVEEARILQNFPHRGLQQ